jgi:hypothetical protein
MSNHTDEIRVQIEKIRQSKRARINWKLTHHTAEIAIRAISGHVSIMYRPGSKSRRRKRHKRLL